MKVQQAIEMTPGAFINWAVETYGVDYDDMAMWEMKVNLDSNIGGELGVTGNIPADLRTLIVARKAGRVQATRQFNPGHGMTEWDIRDSNTGE